MSPRARLRPEVQRASVSTRRTGMTTPASDRPKSPRLACPADDLVDHLPALEEFGRFAAATAGYSRAPDLLAFGGITGPASRAPDRATSRGSALCSSFCPFCGITGPASAQRGASGGRINRRVQFRRFLAFLRNSCSASPKFFLKQSESRITAVRSSTISEKSHLLRTQHGGRKRHSWGFL